MLQGANKLTILKKLFNNYTTNPEHPEDAAGIHAYYQNIIFNMPANVYWLDRNCITQGCNENTLKFVGMDKLEDFIGITYEQMGEFAGWEDWQTQAFKRDDMEVMSTGKPKFNVEEPPFLDKNGNFVYYLSTRVPLFDKNGNVIGVLGISLDITDRKKAEEELRRAKENAEAASQLKSEFIQNMQHDIRTPVGGVRTLLSDMAEREKEDDARKKLILMRDAVEQLEVLCNEVIDFEKVEYDSSPVIAKKFDIHALINRVISLNKTAAFVKKLTLAAHVADDVPRIVKGDDYRTLRILINLIGNAVKFTKEGRIDLTVTLGSQQDKQLIIDFVIQDTGIGIPEDRRQFLYEKFARFTPSNRATYRGSGLGLRIVKQFVEEMGGEIDVKSKEGEGTSFHVILPFETCLLQTVYDAPAEIAPFLGEKANVNHVLPLRDRLDSLLAKKPKPIRLLLIEDDTIAIMTQQRYLTEFDFDVQTAGNVRDAIAILDVTPFDAVLTDYGLQDGTGIDIIKHVKDNPQSLNYSIPFYCCTAHSDPVILTNIKKNGFMMTLAKPFKPGQAESLAIYIRKIMNETSS